MKDILRNSIIITGFSILTIIALSNKTRRRVSSEKFINDFSKLQLSDKDKIFIKKARIYEISLPDRGYERWKRTDSSIYYKKNTKLKVYHYKFE